MKTANPVTGYILQMIESMLVHETAEMVTAYDMFGEKQEQVGALIASAKPLLAEGQKSEAIEAVDKAYLVNLATLQDTLDTAYSELLTLAVHIGQKGEVSQKRRAEFASDIQRIANTLIKAV